MKLRSFFFTPYVVMLAAWTYPLHFLSRNWDNYSLYSVIFGLAFTYIFTFACYGLFRLALPTRLATLITTAIFAALFWNLGTIYNITPKYIYTWFGTVDHSPQVHLYTQIFFLCAAYSLWLIISYFLIRLLRGEAGKTIVLILLHLMCLLPLAQLGYASGHRYFFYQESAKTSTIQRHIENAPDIYFIILDAYGREDILKSLFGYDNSHFTNYLKQKGFYVAEKSHSNYSQTALSLPATLNMDYLPPLDPKSLNRDLVYSMIKNNQVTAKLREFGYQVVTIDSGLSLSIRKPDILLKPAFESPAKLIEFSSELLSASPLGMDFKIKYAAERVLTRAANLLRQGAAETYTTADYYAKTMIHRYQLLRNISQYKSPKFVFVHILAPHPPFIFHEDDPLDSFTRDISDVRLSFGDGSDFTQMLEPRIQEYIKGYTSQLGYINRQIMAFIDRTLEVNPNSIIVIQGDHGPGSHLNWEKVEQSNVVERMSILNTIYFPDGNYHALAPDMTPVNSFRVVFNQYFGEKYALLPNKSYLSSFYRPYDYMDVTEMLNTSDTASPMR